jgi:5S rRNA maturation endonuclease (ribonuclease M5)
MEPLRSLRNEIIVLTEWDENGNCRRIRRYTVRKIGNHFSPFDRETSTFIIPNADLISMTRAEAWEYLETH